MINTVIRKTGSFEFQTEQLKLIHTYRYFSWFATSLFYFWVNPTSHWILKLGVIALIFVSVRIIIKAYNKYDNNAKVERTFIYIETLGIILILLPTGGLNSPFIWYALNPVLISAHFSLYYFCWINLACYLSTSTIISFLCFNTNRESMEVIISKHSQLILIFILITLAVQLLTKLTDKLRNQSSDLFETNIHLNQANKRAQESMDHIMSLYQVVEAFTSQDNKRDIYKTIVNYTAKLTRADISFFWLKSNEKGTDIISRSGAITQEIDDNLVNSLENIWTNNLLLDKTISFTIGDCIFSAVIVKSISKNYGLIGAGIYGCEGDIIKKEEYINQLEFISKLSAIILERFHLEEITERLLIVEEQNRIANEMHDNVTQRLFGISCAVHTIMANWSSMSSHQLQEKLYALQSSAHSAMKDLRFTIYKLSTRKGGQKSFQADIKDYLDNVSKLHNVIIQLEITGDEGLLSVSKKRGLYRIICETTGNAIRHGKCSLIMIILEMGNDLVKLNISDNGEGFDAKPVYNKEHTGLGLQNMKRLVELFNGVFTIGSELGNGTAVNVLIPNGKSEEINEGGLAI